MEELLELKTLLLGGNISEALLLVEEMTEMSKDDKLNKIFSFGIILLNNKRKNVLRDPGMFLFVILYDKFNALINDAKLMAIT